MKEISRLHEACKVIDYRCRLECSHREEADSWCILCDGVTTASSFILLASIADTC
jgi:hypothetical protein